MILRFLPSVLLSFTFALVGVAQEANPAESYREAIKAMPKMSPQGVAILQQWRKVPLDTAVSELIIGYGDSLDALYSAMTAKGECDWGVDLERDGTSAKMPQLGPSVILAKVALLRARQHVADRRSVKAASDILAVRRMARHMSTPTCLTTAQTTYGIEQMALDVLEDSLNDLAKNTRLRLLNAFDQLDPLPQPRDVVDAERVYYRWAANALQQAEREQRTVIVAKDIFEGLGVDLKYQNLKAFERTYRRDLERCNQLQRELVDHVANCRGKPSRALAKFERQRNSWPLLARLMVPQCRNLIVKHDSLQRQSDTLRRELRR